VILPHEAKQTQPIFNSTNAMATTELMI